MNMNIGIIDADLLGRKRHRYPNLASMKISGYHKEQGNSVTLLRNYDNLEQYDIVYISKVFTDTPIPDGILQLPNVEHGGTGFFFDKAPNLPCHIEHHMPDYHLYDEWVEEQLCKGVSKTSLKDYTDCSIGFMTRGCFRKCDFCVNKKYDHAFKASNIAEFYDPSRKRIILWDDNFLAYPKWRECLAELKATGKPFQFRQGLDIRLLTEETIVLFKDCKYYSDYIFAFDNIADRDIIERKLSLWRNHIPKKSTKLYVFCGFDRDNKWDNDFWKQDIIDVFERIIILMKYNCVPYIMRYNKYEESPYRGMYITLARWCNQPSMFKKKSFREYCHNTKGVGDSAGRYADDFEAKFPEIAAKYYDVHFTDVTD